MSVQSVTTGSASALQTAGGRFYLAGAEEFADKLTIGQVIKGRVMRQYDNTRYLVGFDGQERVVDSAAPLNTGELIHGRVIGLGERVELQRIYSAEHEDIAPASQPPPDGEAYARGAAGSAERQVDELFARYQAQLSEADRNQLIKATGNASDASTMALTGLMLSKLGLPQAPELLSAVYSVLMRSGDRNAVSAVAARLEAATFGEPATPPGAVMRLADVLKNVMDDRVHQDPNDSAASSPPSNAAGAGMAGLQAEAARHAAADSDGRRQRDVGDMGRWLLNAQTGSAVAHRLGSLPLLLDDRLIEVDVALFEQRRDAEQKPAAKHRQLVFSLNTEALGRMEIVARLVGERLRVRIVTESSDKTVFLAGYSERLRESLQSLGWTIDEVMYETRTPMTQNGAVRSVVEHVISQDSFNRLV